MIQELIFWMMKDKSIYFIIRYLKKNSEAHTFDKILYKASNIFSWTWVFRRKSCVEAFVIKKIKNFPFQKHLSVDEVHIMLGFCETRLVDNRSVGMCMQSIDKVIHSDTKICLERIHPVARQLHNGAMYVRRMHTVWLTSILCVKHLWSRFFGRSKHPGLGFFRDA